MDPLVPRRALRPERAGPAEEVRARRRPDAPFAPKPEEPVHPQQDDDEQRRVDLRVVLPAQLRQQAPGLHQQGASGETSQVGLGGVAPSALSQARGPHQGAGAPGEEGVDGGCRHRELLPAEGDSSDREKPADLQPHPRGSGLGVEDVDGTAPSRHRYPEGKEYGGGVPQ